jgi:pyrroline-5-carboxylate reductase
MGGALLSGWRERLSIAVLDPDARPVCGTRRLSRASEIAELLAPRVVVIAVKPALVGQVLSDFTDHADDETLFLSVAAGVRIDEIRSALGAKALVARAMPSIAVAKQAGATALYFEPGLSELKKGWCISLFGLVGEVVTLGTEEQLDVATALAGSGPAFFFRFAEALAESARAAGMSPESARILAEATLRGAGALCDGNASLAELRCAVTSPHGTTAAGLSRLDSGGRINMLAGEAVQAAISRARELGS